MRRGIALLGFVVAVATAAVAAMFVGHGPSTASASSHSEAPLISQDPRADNTDLYAFVSPDDTSKVTFVAELHPARGCGQRAELPELRRHRSLRDQDRQLGRRQGRHRLPVQVHDEDPEPGDVPLQHGPDHVAERSELEPAADVQRHARPLQEERQGREARQERAGRAGGQRADAARQHRPALDAELRRARGGSGHDRCRAAARSSPASVTTRSSSTSARSSIWPGCGRSIRST